MGHQPPAFSDKFELVATPNRRPPPSALRLVQGPLPPRNTPKHTLPSLPRRTFYPKVHAPKDSPKPRRRVHSGVDGLPLVEEPKRLMDTYPAVPDFLVMHTSFADRGGDSGMSSPTSEGSTYSVSRPPSPPVERIIRGPWDHAGAIKVNVDVEALLPPLRPVAVNDGLWR